MMTAAVQATSNESRTTKFNKGMVFVKEREFLFNNDKWLLRVNFSLAPFHSQYSLLQETISKLPSSTLVQQQADINSTQYISNIIGQEVATLTKLLDRVDDELTDLRSTLKGPERVKRGVCDGCGSVLRYLFGSLSQDDYDFIEQQVSGLQNKMDNVVHAAREQLTVVQNLTKLYDNQREVTDEITRAAKELQDNVNTNLHHVQNEIFGLTHRMEALFSINAASRTLYSSVHDLREQLLGLRQALGTTSSGRLSPFFLPPTELYRLLLSMAAQLPEGRTFAGGMSPEDIFNYYSLANVHAATDSSAIILYIELPIKSHASLFTLYRALSLPVTVENTSYFVQYRADHDFIAFSPDRLSYALLTFDDLTFCTSNTGVFLCPSRTPVFPHTQNSCLQALFAGEMNEIDQHCRKEVVTHPKPVLYRPMGSDMWIHFLLAPTEVTMQCSDDEVTRHNIDAAGMFSLPQGCQASSPHFTLYPHNEFRSYVEKNTSLLLEPRVQNILSEGQRNAIRTISDDALLLSRVNFSVRLPGEGVRMDLHTLEKAVEIAERAPNVPTRGWDYSHYIAPVAVVVLVIFFCRGCLTRCCKECCCKEGRRRGTREESSSDQCEVGDHPDARPYAGRAMSMQSLHSLRYLPINPASPTLHRGQASDTMLTSILKRSASVRGSAPRLNHLAPLAIPQDVVFEKEEEDDVEQQRHGAQEPEY